jgi:uncharacterized OsmC-like protein
MVKGLDLELSHSRVPAVHDGGDDITRALVDRFEVKIRVEGEFTEEQRQRLEYIAGRCPVKRTLAGSPQFRETVELVKR